MGPNPGLEIQLTRAGRHLAGIDCQVKSARPGVSRGRVITFGKMLRWRETSFPPRARFPIFAAPSRILFREIRDCDRKGHSRRPHDLPGVRLSATGRFKIRHVGMDSEDSITGTGPASETVLAEVSTGVAGTAASDGVSDSAGGGGLAGASDPAGDLAGHGSTPGVGHPTGSIPGGIGATIATMTVRQPTQTTIPTMTIPCIPRRRKTTGTLKPPARHQKIKASLHPSVMQKPWTLSFSI